MLKSGQALNPWNRLNIQLHPNILFIQTHFRVSMLYNIRGWADPLIRMVIRKCVFYKCSNDDILKRLGVPSHIDIRGNEKAYSAAKSGLDLHRVKVGVPNIDFKHHINQYILSTWQDDWHGVVAKKPILEDWLSSYGQCRKDDVVLCRTHLTHSHILWRDPPPECEHCQCILTVCHILAECNNFAEKKGNIYLVKEIG